MEPGGPDASSALNLRSPHTSGAATLGYSTELDIHSIVRADTCATSSHAWGAKNSIVGPQ